MKFLILDYIVFFSMELLIYKCKIGWRLYEYFRLYIRDQTDLDPRDESRWYEDEGLDKRSIVGLTMKF